MDSIAFYEYVVMFSFEREDDRISVGVELSFSFTPPGGRVHVPVQETDAMRHIGRIVTGASTDSDGTIVLDLEDGTTLRFFEHGLECESYRVYLPDGRRIVV